MYDIYLCHSHLDDKEVEICYAMLTNAGYSVYVDWLVDPTRHVSAESATRLRKRMQESSKMIILASPNLQSSRWVPWEIGYFDGLGKPIQMWPLDGFHMNKEEFLGLYLL